MGFSRTRFRPGLPFAATWLLLLPACSLLGPDDEAARLASGDSRLHAVLLNGGGRRETNYHSHLEHLRSLQGLLREAGVTGERLAVFSSDGDDPQPDLATRAGTRPPRGFWLLPKDRARALRPPVVYVDSTLPGVTLRPATRAALAAWFEQHGARLGPGDTLLFYVTDHGKRHGDDPLANTISLWGEEIAVDELRALLDGLDPGVRVVLLMSQCYSGGFAEAVLPEPAAPLARGTRCGYFSVPADRRAYGCYPEVSGRKDVGHSHRLFEALDRVSTLGAAQREVLLRDRTPDVPHATSSIFLARQLEREAERVGLRTEELADRLLAEGWADPARAAPESATLDALAASFGLPSPRSLAELDAHLDAVGTLARGLRTYERRWEQSLEDLRGENLRLFLEAQPGWGRRLAPAALRALGASERAETLAELVPALADFSARSPDRLERLRSLQRKRARAKAARYRAEVREAVLLRMRTLLLDAAGRLQLARAAGPAREVLAGLDACEDLALAPPRSPAAPAPPLPPSFPSLAEERARLAELTPAWLGVQYRAPEAEELAAQGLPRGAAVVTAVLPETAAAQAGLAVADVLLGSARAPFDTPHAFREWIMQQEIGVPVVLRARRDGRERAVTVRLQPFPLDPSRASPR